MNYPGLGTDILLDSAGQLIVGVNGDLALCEDRDCLLQGVVHRLITPLGGLFYDSAFGLDVFRFLHGDNTRLTRFELCRAIAAQLRLEPRILRDSIDVEVIAWEDKVIQVGIRFAWIDGTTAENLVLLAGPAGARAVIDVTGYAVAEQWVGAEEPSGTVDGVNAAFLLAGDVVADTLNLFMDGLLQQSGVDYSLAGRTIVFAVPPEAGSVLRASYVKVV